MKKFMSLVFTLCLIIAIFSSCGILASENEPEISPREKALAVLGYLESGNIEAMREMFCDRLKNRLGIDDEIQEVINLLDGTIISYELTGGSGSGSWSLEGNKVQEHGGGHNITTDKGKIYRLSFHIYIENDFEPDLLGIFSVFFGEVNQNNEGTDWFSTEIRIDI